MTGLHRAALSGLLALALAAPAAGGALTVGSGANVDLGTARLDLGCNDLTVGGTLAAGSDEIAQARDVTIDPGGTLSGESAAIEVAGDWDNAGTFNGGSSAVSFVDGCGLASSVIAGNTSFSDFSMITTTGKLYSFTAGSTQTVTGLLELMGAAGNLLTIRSTLGGVAGFLERLGSQAVAFVDVDDNDATGGNPIGIPPANSVKGANTPGWVTGAVAPALPLAGMLGVALGLVWAARRRLRPVRA